MSDSETIVLVSEIVANYVANNKVSVEDLPALIQTVSGALTSLGQPETTPEPTVAKPTSGQVRKSITDNGLVSFIDGKTYKTLKRHLTTNGMTPQDYKAKYGLPADYPTTAPAYSAARSAMAKSIGLGRKAGEKAPRAPKAPKAAPSGRGRGRPRKDAV